MLKRWLEKRVRQKSDSRADEGSMIASLRPASERQAEMMVARVVREQSVQSSMCGLIAVMVSRWVVWSWRQRSSWKAIGELAVVFCGFQGYAMPISVPPVLQSGTQEGS